MLSTSVTHLAVSCVSFFKLHFDVSCDLLLNRNLAKVNVFVNVT